MRAMSFPEAGRAEIVEVGPDVRARKVGERVGVGPTSAAGPVCSAATATPTNVQEDYTLAVRLWARGDLRCFPSLITERIPLEDAPGVVAALASGEKADSIKTTIQFD